MTTAPPAPPTSAPTTVYVAHRIRTMNDDQPTATAVAVAGGRVVAVGDLDTVISGLDDFEIDHRLADATVLPGLIDQHLHPLLGATTLATEVISTEEWILPGRTFPAADSHEDYIRMLTAAHDRLDDRDEWLFSWGYHELWHGVIDRRTLDAIGPDRPIGIWQRSCHEWYMNSAAIERLGLTPENVAGRGAVSDMVDLERGHAWEVGLFNLVLPKVSGELMNADRMARGLRQMVGYLHQHGVTAFNEPGIAWSVEPIDLYDEILGADEVPILSTFMIDGRLQAASGIPAADAVADAAEQIDRLPATGKVSLFRDQVKLFADGAIISQLMMMIDPYLDADGAPDADHHGEWIMEPDRLRAYFEVYWKAGWQIHTHVNGDAGLDVLLDIVEDCQRDHPRDDHRCVVVHFANSTEAQVTRIADLGMLVSANPYYTVGFADKYGEFGLGPERADSMVRSASVLRHDIPLSFHSDLPMAPAQPLFLASCAVNRVTPSGRVAGPDQRVSVHDAMRAITIEAAYSWRMEDELGSIEPGKVATFTVLGSDPYDVDPGELATITVVGSVYEGTWFPVPDELRQADPSPSPVAGFRAPFAADGCGGADDAHGGCSCRVARALAAAYRQANRAA